MFKVLLAEDDANLRKLLSKHLVIAGYEVAAFENGRQAFDAFNQTHFDIMITDIMMPETDGNRLTKEIKKLKKDFPVIMLTALETIVDKKIGYGSGADDYVIKPVDFEELPLRINALLRRCGIMTEKIITHKNITLDYNKKAALISGQDRELTKKEFLLLFKLMASPDTIFSRNQLLDEVWGYDTYSTERTVDVHINKLREKLNTDEIELAAMRGLGYKAVLK